MRRRWAFGILGLLLLGTWLASVFLLHATSAQVHITLIAAAVMAVIQAIRLIP